ncbi:MAG TPA: N-acetylmuramoyl-L-alanine amidase, partial [Lysobacter sp.]|nr:N-acetylmuramoyl-L-alanine amidase [Lysobacter sp.]
MRVSGATVQKFLLGMALLLALAWNLAHASEIKGLSLNTGATGTRAEIALDQAAEFKVISLAGPDRLVVDLPATHLAHGIALPTATGVVKAVRSGQPQPGTARIVFDLAQPVAVLKPHIEQGAGGPRLVLEWPGDGDEATTNGKSVVTASPTTATPAGASTLPTADQHDMDSVAASNEATSRLISELAARGEVKALLPPPQQTATQASAAVPTASKPGITSSAVPSNTVPTTVATGIPARIANDAAPLAATAGVPASRPAETTALPADAVKTMKDLMRGRGMRPLVIAIDAGHGGQDPGASGLNGKREKDVTLAVARELARQVNATPGLKAYLTRDTDVFIPLNRRAQLARQAKADIFVSIHADAAENRGASGSSVYVLSLKGASSQRARWLADKENASDLIGGVRLEKTSGTLASVLIDLTQSGQMKASEDAATHVLDGLSRIGRNHKPHIERANFAVLRTSDMPAMLVETAFISNPEEERRLGDPAYQR